MSTILDLIDFERGSILLSTYVNTRDSQRLADSLGPALASRYNHHIIASTPTGDCMYSPDKHHATP